MLVLEVRNVCEALPRGLQLLASQGVWENSRAGRVLVMPCPVTTVYSHPRERVLFSRVRDANPFFHIAEALWMIAGRNDVAFLNHFVKDFGERFGEADGTQHGAYGYRWRHAFGFDQLDAVVKQLSEKPESRQAVLQMWDVRAELIEQGGLQWTCGENDLLGDWRDRPCNVAAFLRIREDVLDLTVCCRSNDLVWGLAGSNSVHFSILLEYLAARLDVGVGTYYQVSNNYHVYEDQWNKLHTQRYFENLVDDRYSEFGIKPQPLVHDVESFDEEVKLVLAAYEASIPQNSAPEFNNLFLSKTVWPALMAHRHRATGKWQSWAAQIAAPDWKLVCNEWLERRDRRVPRG